MHCAIVFISPYNVFILPAIFYGFFSNDYKNCTPPMSLTAVIAVLCLPRPLSELQRKEYAKSILNSYKKDSLQAWRLSFLYLFANTGVSAFPFLQTKENSTSFMVKILIQNDPFGHASSSRFVPETIFSSFCLPTLFHKL